MFVPQGSLMKAIAMPSAGIVRYDTVSGIPSASSFFVNASRLRTSKPMWSTARPCVSTVGIGEDAAKKAGIKVNVGKFNFAANARAHANDGADGFVKIIADAKTDKILGAQILGKNAGELISEIVTHMEYGGSAEDLGRTIHAHPTMSEAVKEAGLAVSKSAIHAM